MRTYMSVIDQIVPCLAVVSLPVQDVEPLGRSIIGKNQRHNNGSDADCWNVVIVGDCKMLTGKQGH